MFFLKKLFKKEHDAIDYTNLPRHISIILDGNGRWAKRRGLPRAIGHKEGSKTLKVISKFCDEINIKYLTVYAFSTENWKRPKEEVESIMDLLLEYLKNYKKHLSGRSIRLRVIGDISLLSDEIQREIQRVEAKTKENNGLTLTIALNYGGRDEIVHAIKKLLEDFDKGSIKADDVCEEEVSKRLYTYDIPDPDLLIRPGGEKRISNFLLWQSAYTEFWYTDVLWPDFTSEHLSEAIKDYQNRNRRYGGI